MLKRRPRDLGGIQNACLDHVGVFFSRKSTFVVSQEHVERSDLIALACAVPVKSVLLLLELLSRVVFRRLNQAAA